MLSATIRRSLLAGLGVASLGVLVLLLFTALSLLVPRDRILQQVRAGFAEASILPLNYPPPAEYWRLGRDQWTDCGILQMAVRGDDAFYREVITPRRYASDDVDPAHGPCRVLREVTVEGATVSDLATWRYHRYLHGGTVLTRLVLWVTSVGGLRNVIKATVLASGGLALAVAVWSLLAGYRRPAHAFATVALVALFVAAFGITQHAASISHGPPAALFLLALAWVPFWGNARACRLITLAALFGTATAILEFLEGGSPLGLALILGMSALHLLETRDGARDSHRKDALMTGLGAAAAYTTAIVTAFGLKVALSTWAFGAEGRSSFVDQLSTRVGGSAWTLFGTLRALDKNVDVIFPFDDLAFRLLFAGVVLGSLFILVKLTVSGKDGAAAAFLAASSLAVVPVWYVVFRNHTTVHAWFMVRILAWPIAFGTSLIVFALVERFVARDDRLVPINRADVSGRVSAAS